MTDLTATIPASDMPTSALAEGEPCSEEEFVALLEAALEPAYRLAYRTTRHTADAEDVVQEAALRAYRARHQFLRGSRFRAWFYRIVLNTAFTSARKRPSVASYDELAEAHEGFVNRGIHSSGSEAADPLAETVARMSAEQVSSSLDSLPDDFRIVCTLYFIDDMSYRDIAAVLDVPMGTVRSRLHRGRRMLQQALWLVAADLGVASAGDTVGGGIDD
jgi:RNA polymerase sigma-70 factor, ECF subfamily